jgi:hypothetical protein
MHLTAVCAADCLLTAAAEELDVSEGELRSMPVLWVQLGPPNIMSVCVVF